MIKVIYASPKVRNRVTNYDGRLKFFIIVYNHFNKIMFLASSGISFESLKFCDF